ncbi:MAG: hydrogenase maturation protease [Anaerolineae bacterium]|nr:hydrogenase maturation protease [Anaerolineae bacterium]
MNNDILVIGYGNTLRGDDGVGYYAAMALTERLPDLTVLACHQLNIELAEAVSRAEQVLFIDAREGSQPGRITVETVQPLTMPRRAFSHHLTPSALLECARQIYGRHPQGLTFSVEGQAFGFSEQLSLEVQAALPFLIDRIVQQIGCAVHVQA